jgi:hypothetical protein
MPAGGVYVVALCARADWRRGRRAVPFLSPEEALRWHPGQPIVYIGTTRRRLAVRLRDFYRHRYGGRSPHRGGQAVLLLRDAGWPLRVWWAQVPADRAGHVEAQLLARFAREVSTAVHRLPYANRRRGRRAR